MDALERDFYEERRRKWRRSAFWRGFLVAAVLALTVGGIAFSGSLGSQRDHIARFEISGVIGDDPERDEVLAELAETDSVRALLLRINSPGGTTAGSEALYESIRSIAGNKPVVAVLGEVAASGPAPSAWSRTEAPIAVTWATAAFTCFARVKSCIVPATTAMSSYCSMRA
jgi:protease-4